MRRVNTLLKSFYRHFLCDKCAKQEWDRKLPQSNHSDCQEPYHQDLKFCDVKSLTQYTVDLTTTGYFLFYHSFRLNELIAKTPFLDFISTVDSDLFTHPSSLRPLYDLREEFTDEVAAANLRMSEHQHRDRAAHKFHCLIAPIHSRVMHSLLCDTETSVDSPFDLDDSCYTIKRKSSKCIISTHAKFASAGWHYRMLGIPHAIAAFFPFATSFSFIFSESTSHLIFLNPWMKFLIGVGGLALLVGGQMAYSMV
jgi:hypothetical protein